MSKGKPTVLTAQVAAQIKYLHINHPEFKQHEIAAMVGMINQGRVSEVLSGKRFSTVPPAP